MLKAAIGVSSSPIARSVSHLGQAHVAEGRLQILVTGKVLDGERRGAGRRAWATHFWRTMAETDALPILDELGEDRGIAQPIDNDYALAWYGKGVRAALIV